MIRRAFAELGLSKIRLLKSNHAGQTVSFKMEALRYLHRARQTQDARGGVIPIFGNLV